MIIEPLDKDNLLIKPESIPEHEYLMRFRDAKISVEGPEPFGFNAKQLKLTVESDNNNVL